MMATNKERTEDGTTSAAQGGAYRFLAWLLFGTVLLAAGVGAAENAKKAPGKEAAGSRRPRYEQEYQRRTYQSTGADELSYGWLLWPCGLVRSIPWSSACTAPGAACGPARFWRVVRCGRSTRHS